MPTGLTSRNGSKRTIAAVHHQINQAVATPRTWAWNANILLPAMVAKSICCRSEHLDEVHEGDGAQLAFLELRSPTVSPERAAVLRSALLRYCAHDTWVMVILRRFLCGEALTLSGRSNDQ